MEYMEQQMQTAMAAAEQSYRHDVTFRRFVEVATAEAMRHVRHIRDGVIEERDVHHIAVTAAMAALKLAMESDAVLVQITIERDRYKEIVEAGFRFSPVSITIPRDIPNGDQ